VTHETFGTAPNRQFVISWNDVEFWVNPNMRVSFQVIFYETGGFAFAYNPATTALELGGDSTIGIENGDGSVALQYAFMHPALRPGLGVRFYPPTS